MDKIILKAREQNDKFRDALFNYIDQDYNGIKHAQFGKIMATIGFSDLTPEQKSEALLAVKRFNDFEDDNPCDQHDMGFIPETEKCPPIAWKINVFADHKCESAATDLERNYKVMTLMLPMEW